MISANKSEPQVDIDDFLKTIEYIPEKYFKKLVKEISFYNF
jgi:hypothetical protein